MKLCFVLLTYVLSLVSSFALAQDVLKVPLVDRSVAGSPFEVSGKLLLRETVRANQLEWSWGQKVVVKNISGKPILLFVATLTETGRHPAPAGRHSAPGNGPTYEFADDRFFDKKLIQPHELLVLRDTAPGVPNVACCVDPLAETHDASGEYTVRFVQFADGSVFGDPSAAQGALAQRATIVNGLQELLRSYTNRGATGFAENLKKQSMFSATAPYRRISAKYSDAGLAAAVEETKQILAMAEQHNAMVTKRSE